jgi:membrane associated rhomboid family serine protease
MVTLQFMRAPSRDPTPPWFRPVSERLSPTITALVVVSAISFAAYALVVRARWLFQDHLALGRHAFAGGEVWQLFTSLFVYLEPIAFFFNLIGLWFVGATIERQLGRPRFLLVFFVPSLLANATIAAVLLLTDSAKLFAGCGPGVLALFVAFGRIYDRTPARILGGLVLQARTLTIILVVFALVADVLNGSMAGLAGDLVALGAGYLLSGGRGAGLQELFARWKGRSRRRFQVVEGGRQEDRRSRYLN